jgi:hypothetical protein
MPRRVFFSFHYARDSWRVSQVRNSNLIRREDQNTFLDKAEWEQIKLNGDSSIENWINKQLYGTSVTIILIGSETSKRKWVDYEIKQSASKDNAFIGIYIHNLKNQYQQTDYKGENPLEKWSFNLKNGGGLPLSRIYKTYDWIYDSGRENITRWIEEAIRLNDLYKKIYT